MLTARQRLLASVLAAFGGADLHRFDDRLLLQKRIYLLGAEGVDLGYVHSWYIRGPYSPALTRDAFAIDREQSLLEGSKPASHLPSVVEQKISGLKEALGTYWTDPKQLELMASVVFLSKTGNTNTIPERLKKMKPQYKAVEVEKAIAFGSERGWIR